MDDKDRLLLDLLRRDARRPIVALARDLGLSRTATQDRLAKLRASSAIERFTVIEGAGRARELAYMLVQTERGVRCATIAPRIRALASVETVHSVTGAIAMIVRVGADHIDGIEQVRAEIAGLAGVADVTTHVVLERLLG